MDEQTTSVSVDCGTGSLDGNSAGDHDQPFAGYQAYQFSTRQLARMLQVRSDVLEARLGYGRWASDLAAFAD